MINNMEEIETLKEMIKQAQNKNSLLINDYKNRLQKQYNKVFENDKQLEKDINNALNSSEYMGEEDGIYSWFRVKTDLNQYSDSKEYLENWLSENHCLTIDWKNDCFMNYHGDDNITIQDDTRNDNGVWQGWTCIINESEYKQNGEIDIEKRNSLIESYMQRTGHFPGVFRVTQYGDVYLVETKESNND